MKDQSELNIVEYEPRVKSKIGRVLIWVGVAVLAGIAISTRHPALIVTAILSPGVAGILTSKARVKEKSKE